MFEGLKEVAERIGEEIKTRDDNGWSKEEIINYRAGYDNAFFDVVNVLVGSGYLTVDERDELENIADDSLEKVGIL